MIQERRFRIHAVIYGHCETGSRSSVCLNLDTCMQHARPIRAMRHAHLPQLGLQRLDELPCLAGLKHALLIYAPVGIDPLDDCV